VGVHKFDKLNKTGKILPGLLVVLSFLVMISVEYSHYHSDIGSHKECPVCLLNANADVSGVITPGVIEIPYYERPHFILPGYESDIVNKFWAKDCSGRSPPSS